MGWVVGKYGHRCSPDRIVSHYVTCGWRVESSIEIAACGPYRPRRKALRMRSPPAIANAAVAYGSGMGKKPRTPKRPTM
jgi:hypothetical protein